MEFKKINEDKFQCLLYEEDLEYNNITLDDFFRNDTEKIHNLLEVIMDEAHKNIGVELGGGHYSLHHSQTIQSFLLYHQERKILVIC